MIKIRLRHPRGVTTLDADPEQSLEDLKVLIFSTTEIPPSEQERKRALQALLSKVKYGYPPEDVPNVSKLNLVPIRNGEQVIVTSAPARPSIPPTSLKAINDDTSRHTSLPKPSRGQRTATVVPLTGDAGLLKLVIVPDDNSCLFSAIGLIFEGSISAAPSMRQVVAEIIQQNQHGEYSDAILGQTRASYIAKIKQDQTWGGAIELAAFAEHFRTEIASFDVATGRCDKFGEGRWNQRCFLAYSGIHYDAIVLMPTMDSPPEFQATVFPASDDSLLLAASRLVDQLREEHYYTDTATFDLRCQICGQGLKGEANAREHAKATGHVDFGEY